MTAPVRLRADERGTSLIEFALVLPVLITLFAAAWQLSEVIFVRRKLTTATRTIADLTAQSQSLTPGELDTILAASGQIMAPFAPAPGRYLVSQIDVDGGGRSVVAWSRGRNVAALAKGSAYPVPATIRQNGTSIVVADLTYRYTPSLATSWLGPITLTEQAIMWPRKTGSIPCASC